MANYSSDLARLRPLLIFRLLLVTLLLGTMLIFEIIWPQKPSPVPISLSSFIIFIYILTIAYALALKRIQRPEGFVHLQLLVDATLIAVLIFLTGGFYSIFFPLFYFIVLGATIYLERPQIISLLFYCTFLYLLVIFAHTCNPFHNFFPLPPLVNSNRELISRLFFNLAPFYLSAFVLGIIARERLATIHRLQEVTSDLEEFRDLNQMIISSIDSGLITTDQHLFINSINQAGCSILGLTKETILGQKLNQTIANLPDIFEIIISGRQRHEVSYSPPNGDPMLLGFSFTPLKQHRQKALGWILIFQDLTELKAIEVRLKEADKLAAIGRLAAGIAHEIRNPLAAITGSIEILAEDLPPGDETRQRLAAIILRESTRLNNLISDFLSFSRLERRPQSKVDLLQLLGDIIFIFRSQFPRIRFIENFQGQNFKLQANAEQLEQIFWNLLKNATEAIAESGTIDITIQNYRHRSSFPENKKQPIAITICDNGRGIDEEIVDKIFEPFFTTRNEGTGLGLYITFQLVRINQGEIWIGKRKDGARGTCAQLIFPRQGSGQPPLSAPNTPSLDKKGNQHEPGNTR